MKNSKGFTVIETLIVASVLTVVFVGGYYVWHSNHTNSKTQSISRATKDTQLSDAQQKAPTPSDITSIPIGNTSSLSINNKAQTNTQSQASNYTPTPTPNPYIAHNGALVIDPSSMNLVFQTNQSTGGIFRVTASNGKSLTEVNVVSKPAALTIACCGIAGGLWYGTIYSTYEDGVPGSGVIQLSAKDAFDGTYNGSLNIQWTFVP